MLRICFRLSLVFVGISIAYMMFHLNKMSFTELKMMKLLDKYYPTAKKIEAIYRPENTNASTKVPNRFNSTTVDKEEICSEFIRFSEVVGSPVETNLTSWSFNTSIKCPQFWIKNYTSTPRLKVGLECEGDNGRLVKSSTNSSQDISVTEFGNSCLTNIIQKCCTGEQPVPNVVHYIWFYTKNMSYFHFLSMMSAVRFIKPCLILIHGPSLPTGKYWDYVVRVMPNIIHVKRERITKVFNNTLAYTTHSSDVMRIEALKHYGGIYLDFDEVVLRPLDPLRKYPHTQGREVSYAMGSQLIMAERNTTFLHLWYDGYRNYSKQWGYNALVYPNKLANKYPQLIHVEGYNFTKPDWSQAIKFIHRGNYDWSTNYAMHMLERASRIEINVTTIRRLNTTVGSVSRHIFFGNKELCEG